jgi:hypothetical protein
MTRPVGRAALLLALLFTAAAGLARAAFPRPAAPVDPALAAFGFAACPLPCWAGVEVGRTPFDRAGAQIAAALTVPHQQVTISGDRLVVSALAEDPASSAAPFTAQIGHSGGLVGALRLRVTLPLIGLIDRLGPPTCGRSGRGVELIWLMARGAETIGVTAALDRARPDGTVSELGIAPADADCAASGAHPWRGFGPNWLYR